MSEQPINHHRPDSRATVLTLTLGTLVAVAVFAISFALRLMGQPATSDAAGTIGVICLLVTPAVALATTAVELRQVQRSSALLAILVLVILCGATGLALLVSR